MPGIARHTPTLTGDMAVRLLIADTAMLQHVGDVLESLTDAYDWLEVGDPVPDITASAYDTLDAYYAMQLIGQVSMFLMLAPDGWLLLDGTTYDEVDYPELHLALPSQLKTSTEFTLPDLTGSFVAYTDTLADVGDIGGDNIYNLTVGQLPAHTHTEIPAVVGVDIGGAGPPLPSSTVGAPIASGSTGDGDDIDNRPINTLVVFAVYAGRIV